MIYPGFGAAGSGDADRFYFSDYGYIYTDGRDVPV